MARPGHLIGLIAFLLIVLSSGICRADDSDHRSSFDLRRLVADGMALLQQSGSPSLLLPEAPRVTTLERAESKRRAAPPQLIGTTPKISVVARDWQGAEGLGGTMLTDRLRLSRSSRMVVTRIRMADGIIAPFAQIGFGQWRVDTDVLLGLPRTIELAAQLAFGFEVRTSRHSALGVECDYTAFYRERHSAPSLPMPSILGAFAAAKLEF